MFFLLFFSFHFFLFLKRNFSDLGIAKFIQGVIVVWFLGAILQIVFGKELFSFLLSQRGTEDRGLTSFASEPSFFSLQIAFLLGILILMDPRDRKYLYLWIFILGNILPLSLAGSIYLLSFYFSALLAKKKSIPYGILVAACAVVAFAFYNFEKLQVFRYFQLLETLGSEPLEVFGDASALKRFHQITTPFLLSYENFFSPYLGPVTEFKPTNFVISQDDTVGSFIGNFILRTGALFLGLFLFICWHFRLKSNHLTPLVVLLPGLIMPISSVHPLAYFFLAALFSFLAQRDRHRGGEGI